MKLHFLVDLMWTLYAMGFFYKYFFYILYLKSYA